jgi:hypothetical protein
LPKSENCTIEFELEEEKADRLNPFDKYEFNVARGNVKASITFSKKLSSSHNVKYQVNGKVKKVFEGQLFDEQAFFFFEIYSVPFQG